MLRHWPSSISRSQRPTSATLKASSKRLAMARGQPTVSRMWVGVAGQDGPPTPRQAPSPCRRWPLATVLPVLQGPVTGFTDVARAQIERGPDPKCLGRDRLAVLRFECSAEPLRPRTISHLGQTPAAIRPQRRDRRRQPRPQKRRSGNASRRHLRYGALARRRTGAMPMARRWRWSRPIARHWHQEDLLRPAARELHCRQRYYRGPALRRRPPSSWRKAGR